MSCEQSCRVALFCGHFLPRDQNHVYRQIDDIDGCETIVMTWKRDSVQRFPFPQSRLHILRKPWYRELQRFYFGSLRGEPWRISRAEARSIERVLKKSGAEVLHVYFGHVAIHLLPLLEQLRLPVVVSYHGVDAAVEYGARHHRLMRRVFARADLVLARSQELLNCLESLGASRDRLGLWRTGIDTQEWSFVDRRVPDGGEWIFLQACRFQKKKGLDTTIRVFASIQSRWPQARLRLVGDGPEKEEMLELAKVLNISSAIDWVGFLSRDELYAEMEQAHLLFHPSRVTAEGDREGVPNAMVEAMATGLPIAATRHGGIPEALKGVECVLVEEGDDEGLAKGVLALMQDSKRYGMAAKTSRRSAERGFDLKVVKSQLSKFYRGIASPE